MTKDELISFEKEMADEFQAGLIRAPVHLAGGNEDELIGIFKYVRPDDWVLGTWRMHYHCLLKGVPKDELRTAIRSGRSIALSFPAYRILASAIVGGIAPIAIGIAWAIKRRGGSERVWCFLGDMGERTGIATESRIYSEGHNLPITWVVEDNGMSVCTKTDDVWGNDEWGDAQEKLIYYQYKLTWPHVGTGQWVRF